jgi:hypothetical protein
MKYTLAQLQKIEELYLQQYTAREIAILLNINVGIIFKQIKKAGISRPISEAKRKYTINENLFKNIDCYWKAYFLGWMYSDGNIYLGAKRNSASLCLSEKDKIVLDYFNNKIYNNLKPLNYRKSRYKKDTLYFCSPLYRLTIDSKIICNDLILQGVFPNKSKIIESPLYLKEDFFPAFIQGVFEGDGCIKQNRTITNKTIEILSASKPFLIWLQKVLQNNYNIVMDIRNQTPTLYVLKTSRKETIMQFKDLLYTNAEFKLKRKYEKFNY